MPLVNMKNEKEYESYCRRRDLLLSIVKRTKWDEEEPKVRRRKVVKYINKKNEQK